MKILINEKQLKNIIKEAIPYNIVKPYIGIKRTKGALKLINDVLTGKVIEFLFLILGIFLKLEY